MSDGMRVYLAGGMKSGWQDKVIAAVPGPQFFDPRNHGLESAPELYTMWDLQRVLAADLIFAYLEESNTGAFGIGVEAGAAFTKGTPVILVDELPDMPRFGMLRSIATATLADLDEGIDVLANMVRGF